MRGLWSKAPKNKSKKKIAAHIVVVPPRERMRARRRPRKLLLLLALLLPGLRGEMPYLCENGRESRDGTADDGDRI